MMLLVLKISKSLRDMHVAHNCFPKVFAFRQIFGAVCDFTNKSRLKATKVGRDAMEMIMSTPTQLLIFIIFIINPFFKN